MFADISRKIKLCCYHSWPTSPVPRPYQGSGWSTHSSTSNFTDVVHHNKWVSPSFTICRNGLCIASFPGLPTACSMQKKWRGKARSILSRERHFVYLGRQGGEGSPIERTHFVHTFFVLKQEWYVFHFANIRNSSAWGRNYKIRPAEARFFDRGPLPTSVLPR